MSAVICSKRSALEMQFQFCVKDHGDSSSRWLERRIWLVCIEAHLLAVL